MKVRVTHVEYTLEHDDVFAGYRAGYRRSDRMTARITLDAIAPLSELEELMREPDAHAVLHLGKGPPMAEDLDTETLAFALFALDHLGEEPRSIEEREKLTEAARELWMHAPAIEREAYTRRASRMRDVLGREIPERAPKRRARPFDEIVLDPSAEYQRVALVGRPPDLVASLPMAKCKEVLLRRVDMAIRFDTARCVRWHGWEIAG